MYTIILSHLTNDYLSYCDWAGSCHVKNEQRSNISGRVHALNDWHHQQWSAVSVISVQSEGMCGRCNVVRCTNRPLFLLDTNKVSQEGERGRLAEGPGTKGWLPVPLIASGAWSSPPPIHNTCREGCRSQTGWTRVNNSNALVVRQSGWTLDILFVSDFIRKASRSRVAPSSVCRRWRDSRRTAQAQK